ncbi:P-loop containing nucleoside triphosphate hydrolase protein [Suillus ampliporus]|nr:P-loop containing nucleoside triphosphate hydrolase protein [Suillus ampliporus]
MEGVRSCLLCCQTCITNSVDTEHDKSNPFALDNLLSAGTITVDVQDNHLNCTHRHASDAWHAVPSRQLSVYAEDDVLCKISFLTEHQFLRATCCLGTSRRALYIRIYLVPTDLPNVQASLRHRSEAVLKEGHRHLQSLLPTIVQDQRFWNADELPSISQPRKYFLPRDIDNRTMAEIYSDLPSLVSSGITVGQEIRGLRSTLYEYQRQSVAVMIEKELSNQPVQDPLYIPISSIDGECFYFQPSTLSAARQCPTVARCKGGILCEELGTGKTVMILGLILATVDQLPQPEESLLDYRPIMSPLAYRTFPADEYRNARRRAGMDKSSTFDATHVPSLVEILLHRIRTWGDRVDIQPFEEQLEASNLRQLLQANTPFYHHYPVKSPMRALGSSRTRDRTSEYPRLMYITTATLIVVPVNLLGQWDREILKHCHSTLRHLIIRQTTQIPSARVLASDYDCLLSSVFRRESVKNKVAHLHKLKPCTCTPFPGSRVPDCRCPGDPAVSLVIDEGHTSGNMAATLNYFVRELSIERKWIVTGTPTSNILGLSLGRKQDDDIEDAIGADSSYSLPVPATTDGSASDTSSISDGGAENTVRVWGTYDYVNLRKLGTMISDFLAVPQFHSDLKLFGSYVSAPLCDRRGPRVGAIKVLSQVMEMVMVRHRIEDVEKEVVLPPMQHIPIYMDLDAYAVKSYNAMQASIAINAIDSERRDQDYLFHPRNAKNLQNAMDNLSQGMFWSASDILYNVDQIRYEAPEFLARAVEANVPDYDMALLEQAIAHAEAAAKDPLWRAMQLHEDVPFRVTGMDASVVEAWTRGKLKDRSRAHDLIHANRLCDLRALVFKRPLMSLDRLVEEGKALDMGERARCEKKSAHLHDVTNAAQMKKMVSEVKDELEVMKEKDKVYQAEEVPEVDIDDFVRRKLGHHDAPLQSDLLSSSPLSGTRVGPSLSTKLNFILSEVLEHSEKEKFLIFSNSPLTLAHISEALSLIEIKYLRYTTDVSPPLREQCVMTFESSDTFRVFLMELKLGARGLNLTSASRVIFCEPVWHPDVEAQAIKRAHRIGQTKPITVKTLVIRHTAEEAMVSRRHFLKGSNKVPRMTTEVGMRHFIENPRFLGVPTEPDHSSSSIQISLLTHAEPQAQDFTSTHMSEDSATSSALTLNVIDTRNQPDDKVERALKRPRTVRFAD